jgi:hypothetical protein
MHPNRNWAISGRSRRALSRASMTIAALMAAGAGVALGGSPVVNYIGPNGGNWNTPGNWDDNAVPLGNAVNVNITPSFSATGSVIYDGNYAGGFDAIFTLYVNSGSSNSLSLVQTLANHNLYAQSEIFSAGANSGMTQSASTNGISGSLTLGDAASGTGTYSLSGSGVLTVGTSAYVGTFSSGSFVQSGGTNSINGAGANGLYLGWNSGVTGTYILSAGSLAVASNEDMGVVGTGNVTQSGGTNSVVSFYLGVNGPSAVGTYLFSGGTLNIVGGSTFSAENVGWGGTGTFTQHGGSNNIGTTALPVNLVIGNLQGATGTYIMDAATATPTLSVTGSEYVGNSGAGSLTQTAGTHSIGGSLNVAAATMSAGYVSLSGTAQLNVTGSENIGNGGNGTVNQTGGINNVAGSITLGVTAGSSGTYTLNAAGAQLIDHGMTVGQNAFANFSQINGSHTVHGDLIVAVTAGGAASGYSLQAGTLGVDGNEVVGQVGFGQFTQGGGTNTVGGSLTVGASVLGSYFMSGGSLGVTGSIVLGNPVSANGTFGLTGGIVTTGGSFIVSPGGFFDLSGGSTLTVSGTLTASSNVSVAWVGPATVDFLNGYVIDGHFISTTLGPGQSLITGGPAANDTNFALATGTLGGTGNFTNNSTFSVTGGTIGGSGTYTNNAEFDVFQSSTFSSSSGLVNEGTVLLNPSIIFTVNAAVTNHGTINIASGGTMSGSGTLTNAADGILATAGTLAMPLVNNGIVQITAGPALFNGNVTNNGSIQDNTGSQIQNNATFTSTAGTLHVGSGSFVNSGTATIGGTQFWGAGSIFVNSAGTATFQNDTGTALAGLVTFGVNAGTVVFNTTQHVAGVSLSPGAQITMSLSASTASPNSLNMATLTFNGGGIIDLANNELFTTTGVSAIFSDLIVGEIFTSHHGAGTALGYAALANGQTEVRYTLLGDTDLNGLVNVVDLANLAGNIGKTSSATWIQGDFDYNGNVNVADLADLAGNFGKQLAAGGSADATPAATAAAVPEPASLGLIEIAGLVWLSHRRARWRRRESQACTPPVAGTAARSGWAAVPHSGQRSGVARRS